MAGDGDRSAAAALNANNQPPAADRPTAVEGPAAHLNSIRDNLGALRAEVLGLPDDNLMPGTSPEELVGLYRRLVSGLSRNLRSIADDLSVLAGDGRDIDGGIAASPDILGFHAGLHRGALDRMHTSAPNLEMPELARDRDIEAGTERGSPNRNVEPWTLRWKKYMKEGFAEAMATFFVVLFSCGATAISVDDPAILPRAVLPIVGGLLGVAQSFIFGHISGSHANPVVTICFACFSEFQWVQVPFYIAGQFSGALMASLTLRLALCHIKDLRTTTPMKFSFDAMLMEILVSMFMMFAKIASTDPRAYKKFGGIAVGSALMIGSFFAGSISGGSMNPFKSLGCAMTTGDYDHLWVFFAGPFIGSFIASVIYSFIFDPKGMIRSQVWGFILKVWGSVWGLVSDRIEEIPSYRTILLAFI